MWLDFGGCIAGKWRFEAVDEQLLTDNTLLYLLDLLREEAEILAVLDPHLQSVIVDVHVALVLITGSEKNQRNAAGLERERSSRGRLDTRKTRALLCVAKNRASSFERSSLPWDSASEQCR